MVKPRKPSDTIRQEFADGILPGLNGPHGTQPEGAVGQQGVVTAGQPATLPSKRQDSDARKKVTLYLDDPTHTDIMDDLLSALKRFGLPRDNSMLVRALLVQAADALTDPDKLQALARACAATPTKR